MYNDAKKASNSKYLSKFKPISLRVMPEEAEQITAAAAEAGESAHAFILKAVRQRISGEHDSMRQAPDVATGDGLQLDQETTGQAERAAEATGELVTDWIRRAIRETAATDARQRELAELLKEKK